MASSVKHLSVYIGGGRFLLGSLVKSLRTGMAQTGFLVPIESLREDVTKVRPARWPAVTALTKQA